ncbi:hypothetical protein CYLTODRAFT_424944 [Cylindrobasidium torrendii FP15055 ss-10]|uniref:Uncharacterized protein n=1 Tax=Cylindrobasidium torrendii FP15055 ss-10 TaxID=1314674 RepID=A0A0D7B3L6_9AGAR|nr:hypothetical protein CYLTODRAFT_424944 [Cylindrobasidium torrendii FP15055 ss-10]
MNLINELLPDEILRDIFSQTQTHDFDFLGRQTVLENTRVAAAISHVSQRWRDVALAHHHLWTYIPYRNGNIAKVSENIKRSGPLPLSLYIWLDREDPAGLAIIRQHLSRAQHLSICADEHNTDYLQSVLCSHTAPLLESLSFTFHGKEDIMAAVSVPYLPVAPWYPKDIQTIRFQVLRRLRITGIELRKQVDVFSSPLGLTSVVLEGMTPVPPIIATSASTLTSLTLVSPCFEVHLDGPIVLPALQSLVVYGDEHGLIAAILRAPNLKSLGCYSAIPSQLAPSLAHLACRWHAAPVDSLERMSFGTWQPDAGLPIPCVPPPIFHTFPNVMTLHITGSSIVLLQAWSASLGWFTKAGGFPWPKLASIQVDDERLRALLVKEIGMTDRKEIANIVELTTNITM